VLVDIRQPGALCSLRSQIFLFAFQVLRRDSPVWVPGHPKRPDLICEQLSRCNRTYAVHGFKAILLKDGGFTAIRLDLLFLVGLGIAQAGDGNSSVQAHPLV
jgi:hypothetical protein